MASKSDSAASTVNELLNESRTASLGTNQLTREHDDAERQCMLSRHPSAGMYADFGDFAIFKFELSEAHLVAGFGRIQTLSAKDLTAR